MIRVFDNFLFNSYEGKNFKFFKAIVYLYVFLFVGYHYFPESVLLNKSWEPISFFKLMNLKTWFFLAPLSFYLLKVSALLSLFDRFFRISSKLCFISIMINLGFYLNFGKVSHGYHLLAMTLGLLSLVKFNEGARGFWTLQLLKIYAVLLYFYAGLNKMIFSGLEWVFSENLSRIITAVPGKTKFAYRLLECPMWVMVGLAFYVVFIVQFLSVTALFSKRMAILFFINASFFHIGVQVTLGGHTSFLSHVICLLVFIPLAEMCSLIQRRVRQSESAPLPG